MAQFLSSDDLKYLDDDANYTDLNGVYATLYRAGSQGERAPFEDHSEKLGPIPELGANEAEPASNGTEQKQEQKPETGAVVEAAAAAATEAAAPIRLVKKGTELGLNDTQTGNSTQYLFKDTILRAGKDRNATVGKFVARITASPNVNKAFNESIDTLLSTQTSGSDSTVSYELIIEHERGISLFGFPFFSKTYLLRPTDPPAFVNQHHKTLNIANNGATKSMPNNTNLYPINEAIWRWKWDKWYVLMLDKDIDDQGWIYAGVHFGSNHWIGKCKFNTFVRKRVWIRIKERVHGV